jgi:glutamyl-Q tRNA(Asp) synthetase
MSAPRPTQPDRRRYVGRFAPSPSGPLHLGSIVAALGSWLDARAAGGRWLLRIEDLDPPRERAGAADRIRTQLQALGLQWDGAVTLQSNHGARYAEALRRLAAARLVYCCRCTRRDAARWPRAPGSDEALYPGICRGAGLPVSVAAGGAGAPGPALRAGRLAIRWRLPDAIVRFDDRLLGPQDQHPSRDAGDPVLRRADGLWAYQLAVVVDDGDSGVTDVVRGRDLLTNTGRQILLQQALGLPTPRYLHLPLVTDASGRKLSKHEGDDPAGIADPVATLDAAARWLRIAPVAAGSTDVGHWLDRAIDAWRSRLSAQA